jgi:hypothetical protein
MSTRSPESTHEAEPDRAQGKGVPVDSPSADRMTGANGPSPQRDQDASAGDDQDIDTAGTDADEKSPTKAIGTGTNPDRARG